MPNRVRHRHDPPHIKARRTHWELNAKHIYLYANV